MHTAGIRCFIIAVIILISEQIAFADTLSVESDTQILVQVAPLTKTGGSLSLTLLDDLNQPIIDVPVQIEIFSQDDKPIKRGTVITDPNGQAVYQLGLSPGTYTGKVQFSGHSFWHSASKSIEFKIVRCQLQTSLQASEPIFQPYSKPLSLQIHRSSCLQFDVDYMVSVGSTSSRIHLDEGQESAEIQLFPKLSHPEMLALELSAIEGNLYEHEVLHHDVVFYDSLSESRPQLRRNWQNTWVELQLHPYLRQFPVSLQIHDAIIETSSDERGIASFILPSGISGCVEADIYRTDQFEKIGRISDEICIPETTSNWRTVIYGMVLLAMAFSAFSLRKKLHFKPKLAAPNKIQSAPVESVPLPPEDTGSYSIICRATDLEITPSEVEIEIKGKILHPDVWPFTLHESGTIRIKHRACMDWNGTLRPGRKHSITLTTRREYAISCFNQASAEKMHWGRETPALLLEYLKKRYPDKETQEKAQNYCTLISEAAFNEKLLSDSELKELYEFAREIRRRSNRFSERFARKK